MHDDAGQPNDYQNWMVPKAHPLCKKNGAFFTSTKSSGV
jgi:hypothetical protein